MPAAEYELEFSDDFRGPSLDRSKWLPFYLPHWSSRERAAAYYATGADGLTLSIAPDQPAWCPEVDGPIRVSSIQTGEFAGALGSPVGQHRFKPDLRVAQEQSEERLYVPLHGRFEMRARMVLHPGQLAALLMIGFEDEPHRSGEITIMEIFGDSVDGFGAELGHGIKAVNDPALVTDFAARRLSFEPQKFHVYAAQWDATGVSRPDFDDVLLRRIEQSPAYPMQFMLNVYELRPSDAPPPVMQVDWFRGFRLNSLEIEPVAQRFGDVRARHLVDASEVGEGARDLQHAVIGAGRKVEALGGLQQEGLALPVGVDHGFDQRWTGARRW